MILGCKEIQEQAPKVIRVPLELLELRERLGLKEIRVQVHKVQQA